MEEEKKDIEQPNDEAKVKETEGKTAEVKATEEPDKTETAVIQLKAEEEGKPELNSLAERVRKLENQLREKDGTISELTKQISAIHTQNVMDECGISKDHREDLMAIIIGHGDEPTDENVRRYAETHKEWKSGEVTPGIITLGAKIPEATADNEKEDVVKKYSKYFR